MLAGLAVLSFENRVHPARAAGGTAFLITLHQADRIKQEDAVRRSAFGSLACSPDGWPYNAATFSSQAVARFGGLGGTLKMNLWNLWVQFGHTTNAGFSG